MAAARMLLLAWVGGLSLVLFALTLADKSRARRGRRRIPEATLLGLALAGGSPGLLAGMLVARHKTRKPSFLAGFVLIALLQAAVGYLAWRSAMS